MGSLHSSPAPRRQDPPARDKDPPARDKDPPARDKDPPARDKDPPARDQDPPARDQVSQVLPTGPGLARSQVRTAAAPGPAAAIYPLLSSVLSAPWHKDGLLYGQDFAKLRRGLLRQKLLFTDPSFPPCSSSMRYSGHVQSGVSWLRPHQLYSRPRLLVDGAGRNDVNQGRLGDCWLLCALAGLAESNHRLFERVVARDQGFDEKELYAGIFHFKFWQYGEWVEVVVDDLLPTRAGRPVYVTSDDRGEMWPCLVEKAYAKLHGSYQHLDGGYPVAAMVDFTGGFPETHGLQDGRSLSLLGEDLLPLLWEAMAPPGTCVCVTTVRLIGSSMGLAGSHAYTVLGVREGQGVVPRLVRVRNPWGSGQEWQGAWGKVSRELSSLPAAARASLATGEGEWWMAYTDFLAAFTSLSLCLPVPEGEEELLQGAWQGREGGALDYPDFPQYQVRVTRVGLLRVALMQKDRRQLRDEQGTEDTNLPISLSLLRVPSGEKLRKRWVGLNKFIEHTRSRGVTVSQGRFGRTVTLTAEVTPGPYLLLPRLEDRMGQVDFCLRVWGRGCRTSLLN